MKTLLTLLLLATSAHAYPADPEVLPDKFLAAIAQREQNGEGNTYGLRADVWRQHMAGIDYAECARDPFLARWCAIKHLNWLANEIAKAGYPPNAYTLAAAWHLGLRGFLKQAKQGRSVEYGLDVQNLYQEEMRKLINEHHNP